VGTCMYDFFFLVELGQLFHVREVA
jgi:hypothetical protein